MELRTSADVERYLNGFFNVERTRDFDYEALGLERIRRLLESQGNPERAFDCIHIAGSKGKGSVALACEQLLRAAGRRTGTYTSPHLSSWSERFRVDGEPVSGEVLARTLATLYPAIEAQRRDDELRPSFFDVSTALALVLFRELGVDAGVIEVGLGGRLDSTNLVHPRVSVLTSIELEHTDKLGDSLEAIAIEKAGILKPQVPVVHGPLPAEALVALTARAIAEDCPLEEVRVSGVRQRESGIEFPLPDGRKLRAPVLGAHQATNLALAVRAAEVFLERTLEAGELESLARLRLPGRLELLGGAIVDSAHTVESARSLRESLRSVWPERDWVLLLSISKDKDIAGVLAEFAPVTRCAVLSRAEPARSLDPEHLEALAWASGIEHVSVSAEPAAALAAARASLESGELLVVAGSVYFAGAIRTLLEGALLERASPGADR